MVCFSSLLFRAPPPPPRRVGGSKRASGGPTRRSAGPAVRARSDVLSAAIPSLAREWLQARRRRPHMAGGEPNQRWRGPCGRTVAAARGAAHLLGASTTASARTAASCATVAAPTGGWRPHAAWDQPPRADGGSGPREHAGGAGAITADGNGDSGAWLLLYCDCPRVLPFHEILDLAAG